VVVAGGGIAGLTAALAMARAGLLVTVMEKAEKLEETGAGLQLGPNATRVLIGLGLRERLSACVMAPQAIRVMAGRSAREIVRIPLGAEAERRFGAPYWTVHRGDLQAALADAVAAERDVKLRLGTKFEDFVTHDYGLTVQGRRGTQMIDERGVALIGADGMWSAVRDRLGRHHAPRFAHRTAWRALVPADSVPQPFREPLVHLWLGEDAHLVHYPVKDGKLINMVAVVHDDWREPGWSAPGEAAEILRAFARWAWADSLRDLIATPAQWLKWALFERHQAFRGGAGAVTLIGDAAHPMLPFLAQGAGMAIEDAAVLAAMLAEFLDDPADALRAYEGARRHRVARARDASRRQGRIYGMSGPEALVRNLAMQALGGEKLLRRHDWLYSWRAPEIKQRVVT
jgi:salicylate hydroxylase